MFKLMILVVSLIFLKTNGQEETTEVPATTEAAADAPETTEAVADAEPTEAPAEGEAPPEETPAPEGGAPTEATPPAGGGGCASNVDESQPGDIVHPNLESWKTALVAKKDKIKGDMSPVEGDDAATIALKGRFKAQMTQVENMMADEKLMANTNQMDIAYTMAKVESVLNTIGRNLYGINWRTRGCGAGFVLTNECGNQVKK